MAQIILNVLIVILIIALVAWLFSTFWETSSRSARWNSSSC